MNSNDEVHVVALLGESTGIITELLWYLVVVEGLRVTGCEIWTTTRGLGSARDGSGFLGRGGGMYEELLGVLGEHRDRVPLWDHAPPLNPDVRAAPAPGFRTFVPRDGADLLEDVGDRPSTLAFGRALAARFASLRSSPVALVGSLAGGRKAMGAVFHSVFTLYARQRDRLVHVIVDPRVEKKLGFEGMRTYACPTREIAMLAPESQVSVYDVPFLSASDLVDAGPGARARTFLDQARAQLAVVPLVVERVTFEKTGATATLHVGTRYEVGWETVMLYAILLHGPVGGLLPREIEDRMPGRRSNETIMKMLNNLARDMRLDFAGHAAFELVPRRLGSGRWRARAPAHVAIGDVEPARVLAALFPTAAP